MNFSIPDDLKQYLADLDRLADEAGFYRISLPKQYGGQNSEDGRRSNLWMAVIREHLAAKGLGLFNDLQTEHSMVGTFPGVVMLMNFNNAHQKEELIPLRLQGKFRMTFGLTEPGHGPDATHGDKGTTRAWTWVERLAAEWVQAMAQWTLNMPTDHATVSIKDVWVPESAALGHIYNGLGVAQAFVHETRIRRAASSLGAAVYCVQQSVKYANDGAPFGTLLSHN
ncbi:CaiA Acyl-CoA dehydrogenase [Pyrenophora teres f. maculata]|nr:CaiA Acyl-CoA dehydrogenase [Pyrenophora teres f. maculata]